ncbi:MAG: hypothetical protein PVF83_04660 [Anaerolineales bacterium]|jgi:predicted NBD/HSP70 family sugar kinase
MTSTASPNTCYRHPNRETNLRCNRCDRYICPACAKRTPTGYRCPDCIKEQQKVFDTARPQDYILAFIVAAVLSYIGSLIVQAVGFFLIYLVILVGPSAGFIIAEAVRRVVSRRRSKILFQIATLGVVLGGSIVMLDDLYYFITFHDLSFLYGLLWPGIYIVLAAGSTYAGLSGIRFR